MILTELRSIAEQSNWKLIATPIGPNEYYLDFSRPIDGEEPFTFSAQWDEYHPEYLIEDIKQTEETYDPKKYLKSLIDQNSTLTPSRISHLLCELDKIHSLIWVLRLNMSIYILEG